MCKRCDKIFRQVTIRKAFLAGKLNEITLREKWEREYVEWLKKHYA